MNTKNTIMFSLGIIFVGFIQTSNAYDYTIVNNTKEDISVQIITSSQFAPKPTKSIDDGLSGIIKIGGVHKGAGLSQISVKGEKSGDESTFGLSELGVKMPFGNKKFVVRSKDDGFSIQQLKK